MTMNRDGSSQQFNLGSDSFNEFKIHALTS